MIISIASGKGGAGKTSVAGSLALALSHTREVQVLDCDVEEPNLHLFLQPRITVTETVNKPVPVIDRDQCDLCGKCVEVCAFHALAMLPRTVLVFEDLCHGCGGCATLCPSRAITEKPLAIGEVSEGKAGRISFVQGRLKVGAALAPPVIRAVRRKAKTDVLVIIDAPPGTSCPAVASVADADYCVLVTEPTPFGLHDLRLAVAMVREIGVPYGVVINRAGLNYGQVEEFCRAEGIEVLMQIPFERRIARAYAQGRLLTQISPRWREAFVGLGASMIKKVGR